MEEIALSLPGPRVTCPIYVGKGALGKLGPITREHKATMLPVVSDETVAGLFSGELADILGDIGIDVIYLTFPPGEPHKNLATVEGLAEKMLAAGVDRSGIVVALGGGVVGDVAGFLAAIYMRGLKVIQVPTTLLAQVDSSIGGKTGVDTAHGKNLLGAFHQPTAVLADPRFLTGLPVEQLREGLSEALKAALLGAQGLLELIEERADDLLAGDEDALVELVAGAAAFKAEIVEKDERESGLRMILNLGHTLGHALEAASNYELSHGRAVASGMAGALALSRKLLGLPGDDEARVLKLLDRLGLPSVFPPEGFDITSLSPHLKLDKKKRGELLRLVLLEGIGRPKIVGIYIEELLSHIEGLTP